MTTASIADPSYNGTGHLTLARMRSVLSERAGARRHFDRLLAAPRAAWDYLAAQAGRLGAGRAWRVLTGKARWVAGLLRTGGAGNIAVLTVTTHAGRSVARTVLSVTAQVLAFPLRLACTPLRWALSHLGVPGRKVVTAATVVYCFSRDKIAGAVHSADCWLADRHDHPVMALIRSLATISLVRRLIVRFAPSGWWRLAGYVAAAYVLPDPGFAGSDGLAARVECYARRVLGDPDPLGPTGGMTRRQAKAVEAAESDAAAPEPVPAATAQPGVERPVVAATAAADTEPDGTVLRGNRRMSWSINGYAPSRAAFDITVERAGIRERVTVHPQHDGAHVYQFGRNLYVGRVPAGVDHQQVADAIAAAAAVALDTDSPAPGNRGARRAQARDDKRAS